MFCKVVAMFVVGFTMSTLAGTVTENLDVFRGVQQQVLGYTQFTIFDSVQAKVNDGVVTLTGKVTMPYKREDIGRLVEKANGVRDVRITSTSCRCRTVTTNSDSVSRERSTETRTSGPTRR